MKGTRNFDVLVELELLEKEVGRDLFWRAIKVLQRRKVPVDREKRKNVSWAECKRLYYVQGADCAICGQMMPLMRGHVEADHIDPERKDFNAKDNLQLVHRGCNRKKGAKTVHQMVKTTRKGIMEFIK